MWIEFTSLKKSSNVYCSKLEKNMKIYVPNWSHQIFIQEIERLGGGREGEGET